MWKSRVLIGCAFILHNAVASAQEQFPPEQIKQGASIYSPNCAPCHGPRMADPQGAFDLRTFPPDQKSRFITSVTKGKNSMPYVVLSYSYWHSRFHDDKGVVGRAVEINKHPFTIIGVAQPEFFGVIPGNAPDIFLPSASGEQILPRRQAPVVFEPGTADEERLRPGAAAQPRGLEIEEHERRFGGRAVADERRFVRRLAQPVRQLADPHPPVPRRRRKTPLDDEAVAVPLAFETVLDVGGIRARDDVIPVVSGFSRTGGDDLA